MDNAESYIGTVTAGDDIERRAKPSERRVPQLSNSDSFSEKEKKLKMRNVQVKGPTSLIKIIFIRPFK